MMNMTLRDLIDKVNFKFLRNFTFQCFVYVLVAFLTFGHYYNSRIDIECDELDYECESSKKMLPMTSVYAGLGWPIYWTGVVAIKITK